MNKKVKQPISRRQQVKNAGSTVFIVVAVAAVIVMFSLTSLRFLWERKSYNKKVILAKTKARDDLKRNLTNLDKLSEQFPQLDSSASTNSKTILHALPPIYDYAALASSIDYLATTSGVKSNTSIGQDISATAVGSTNVSMPVEIPLDMKVSGSYEAVRQYVLNLERSIRPIHAIALTYNGSNKELDLTIKAKTYYQPSRSLDVLRSTIQ